MALGVFPDGQHGPNSYRGLAFNKHVKPGTEVEVPSKGHPQVKVIKNISPMGPEKRQGGVSLCHSLDGAAQVFCEHRNIRFKVHSHGTHVLQESPSRALAVPLQLLAEIKQKLRRVTLPHAGRLECCDPADGDSSFEVTKLVETVGLSQPPQETGRFPALGPR